MFLQALLCSFLGVPASPRLGQGTGPPELDLSWYRTKGVCGGGGGRAGAGDTGQVVLMAEGDGRSGSKPGLELI